MHTHSDNDLPVQFTSKYLTTFSYTDADVGLTKFTCDLQQSVETRNLSRPPTRVCLQEATDCGCIHGEKSDIYPCQERRGAHTDGTCLPEVP
jgi:hypothetical protein